MKTKITEPIFGKKKVKLKAHWSGVDEISSAESSISRFGGYISMRVVVQRVSEASVTIKGKMVVQMDHGLLILLGIEEADNLEDIDWLVSKIVKLRIFSDEAGNMNLSIKDIEGDAIIVSQFTLHASTKKGNRPSFIKAARSEQAIPLYEKFISTFEKELGKPLGTGEFGAMMEVALVNDGPVTILIDSKNKE